MTGNLIPSIEMLRDSITSLLGRKGDNWSLPINRARVTVKIYCRCLSKGLYPAKRLHLRGLCVSNAEKGLPRD